MTAITTNIGIANRALDKLGEPGTLTTLSTSGATKGERFMARNYEPIRDAVLRAHPWGFAIRRTTLTAHAEAPAWGYTGAYLLPSDYLRLLNVRDFDEDDDYTIEALTATTTTDLFTALMLNSTATLYIRYVAQITDVTRYDPLFIEALASKLAYEGCEEITQSNTKKQAAAEDFDFAIKQAYKTNAVVRSTIDLPDTDWITTRA